MSEIQRNLKERNTKYASGFTQGDLALPPAKKYIVGRCSSSCLVSSIDHGQ